MSWMATVTAGMVPVAVCAAVCLGGCEAERIVFETDHDTVDAASERSTDDSTEILTQDPGADVDDLPPAQTVDGHEDASSPDGSSPPGNSPPAGDSGSFWPMPDLGDASPGDWFRPPRPPRYCMRSNECDSASYCETARCGDIGICRPVPLVLSAELKPVCGCDGITYYNDSYRQAAREGLQNPQECTNDGNVRFCGPAGECPWPSECARLFSSLTSTCEPDTPWTCWVVPAVCSPDSGDSDRWTPCSMQGSSQAPCVDTCSAIRNGSGGPYRRALDCP